MDLKSQFEGVKRMMGNFVNLTLIPVRRLPGALFRFFADEWTRYEQRQAWRRHVQGTDLDPSSREEAWFPDPRIHH